MALCAGQLRTSGTIDNFFNYSDYQYYSDYPYYPCFYFQSVARMNSDLQVCCQNEFRPPQSPD